MSFIFFLKQRYIRYGQKKNKRRMRDPPHKIKESDQNMTEAPPLFKGTCTKISPFMAIYIYIYFFLISPFMAIYQVL